MAECHRCRWNDQPPSPEKERACLACSLPEDYVNHKGKVFVSFESGPSVQTAAEVKAAEKEAERAAENEKNVAIDLDDPEILMAYEIGMEVGAMRLLKYLSDIRAGNKGNDRVLNLLEVVSGKKLADIARELGVTRQALSIEWGHMVDAHPELRLVLKGYWTPPPPERKQIGEKVEQACFDFGESAEARNPNPVRAGARAMGGV